MTEQDSKRLQRIDHNVRLIADILVGVVTFGLALGVGQLVQNVIDGTGGRYSWIAAIPFFVTLTLGDWWRRFVIER